MQSFYYLNRACQKRSVDSVIMPDIKKAFAKATHSSTSNEDQQPSPRTSSDHGDSEDHPEKYLLRVTAGPSYDVSTHQEVHVNGDEATSFESDAMSVKVRVRIQGYNGATLFVQERTVYQGSRLTQYRSAPWLA